MPAFRITLIGHGGSTRVPAHVRRGHGRGDAALVPAGGAVAAWRLVRQADAMGAADPRRRRSGTVRSAVLARLLQAHALRRGMPVGRRLRGLLPDEGSVPLS